MAKQFSMFDDMPDKTQQPKKAKLHQKALFTPVEMVGAAHKTSLVGDWRGTLALEREDPRSEEEKASDRQQEAENRTMLLFDWTYYEEQAHYWESRAYYLGDQIGPDQPAPETVNHHADMAARYYLLALEAKRKAGLITSKTCG